MHMCENWAVLHGQKHRNNGIETSHSTAQRSRAPRKAAGHLVHPSGAPSTAPWCILLKLLSARTGVSLVPAGFNINPLSVANHFIQGWKVHRAENIPG